MTKPVPLTSLKTTVTVDRNQLQEHLKYLIKDLEAFVKDVENYEDEITEEEWREFYYVLGYCLTILRFLDTEPEKNKRYWRLIKFAKLESLFKDEQEVS